LYIPQCEQSVEDPTLTKDKQVYTIQSVKLSYT